MVSSLPGLLTFFVRSSALSTLIRFIRLLLACLSFAGTAVAADQRARTIVVLRRQPERRLRPQDPGRLGYLLEQRLAPKVTDTALSTPASAAKRPRAGVARLPRALDLHKPAIVILELGGNDGLRGLPLATSRANLASMPSSSAQTAKAQGGARRHGDPA